MMIVVRGGGVSRTSSINGLRWVKVCFVVVDGKYKRKKKVL